MKRTFPIQLIRSNTHVIVAVCSLIFFTIFPVQVLSYGGDAYEPSGYYDWTIKNLCTEPIKLAVYYTTGEDRTITQGWWIIMPGAKEFIKMNSEWICYYAVSTGTGKTWGDPNGRKCGINLYENFTYPNDGLRHGPQVAYFHWISIIEAKYETSLSCY